jgi:hypothetical protein
MILRCGRRDSLRRSSRDHEHERTAHASLLCAGTRGVSKTLRLVLRQVQVSTMIPQPLR